MRQPSADRLRVLIDLVVESLDEPARGGELASRAFLSRFHFDHLFKAGTGEPPAAFRQRLLLERAAYRLRDTGEQVTMIAYGAGYGSPEAFSRSFKRAFGVTPHRFRREGAGFRLKAPNGVHFHPPCGLLFPGDRDHRRAAMDLVDRLLEHDLWHTTQLLDRARELSDAQLDLHVELGHETFSFDPDRPTVRAMVRRLVYTKEMWTAVIAGRVLVENNDQSIVGMKRRLEASGREFVEVVRRIRDESEWNSTFLDAMCDPPEAFTFGGMVAHVITYSAYRRQQLLIALSQLGLDGLGDGNPITWEEALA